MKKLEPVEQSNPLTKSHNDKRVTFICDFCGLSLFSKSGIHVVLPKEFDVLIQRFRNQEYTVIWYTST